MKAERLLQLYDRVSEAPDAVQRLRKFILDLAVRGKLVEQDPDDEPVSAFLKKISAEKRSVGRKSRSRGSTSRPNARVAAQEFHELPETWAWTEVGDVFFYDAGIKRAPKNIDQGLWLLELEDVEKDTGRLINRLKVGDRESKSTKSEFRVGDILYGKLRPYLNKVLVADEPGVSTTEIVAIRPVLPMCSGYCALAFRRPGFVEYVTRLGQGTKMPRLRTEDAIVAPFPLPPVPEQHRIVAKVDELMALCDSLEAEREKREATRDRLTTASLSRLTAPGVDGRQFKAHADFAIKVLPELTTRPDQINVLRQTILDLAVRGKLVEQDPNDEPGSELLKEIASRISALVSKGELKKSKPANPVSRSVFTVGLPPGWALARFGAIASIETNLVDPNAYKHMPHIAPDNIESWTGRLLPYTSVGDSGVFSGKHLFKPGVLLYSKIRPNLAKVTKVDFGGLCSADMYPILPFISREFLLIFMLTRAFVDQAVSEENRVAMPKINQAALSEIIVCVPPLLEQHRIVEKVNELLIQCAELERKLNAQREPTTRLLEVVLRGALDPVAPEAV